MDVFIETYRKVDIYFNTERERFYSDIDESSHFEKQSFAAAKKYIDDWIKNNYEFKPFQVQRLESNYDNGKTITIVGIRKDGRFVFESEKGLTQLSEYDEKYYFLLNEENDKHLAKIAVLRSEIDEINKKIKLEEKALVKVYLPSIKANYLLL